MGTLLLERREDKVHATGAPFSFIPHPQAVTLSSQLSRCLTSWAILIDCRRMLKMRCIMVRETI